MRTTIWILLALLASGPLAAQDPLLEWMDRIAQDQLTQREAAIAAIRTPEQARERRQWIRAKLLEIIGGLPDYKGPLNARVTGQLTNSHYTLEKVIFDSLPQYYITANLYRPNRPGRYPAVLLSSGHTTTGKTENHRIAAHLASKGFVALAYDPVGLGERIQACDRRTRRGLAGCCVMEHLHAGTQSFLINQSVARYFIWDAMRAHDILRAADYLAAQPGVDAKRIRGVACDVRGFWLLMAAAVDQRIEKIWLDRTPHSFSIAMDQAFNTNLFEALIPGFLLHWDVADLTRAVEPRTVLWTDPSDWMNRTAPALGPAFRYRYTDQEDEPFLTELLK